MNMELSQLSMSHGFATALEYLSDTYLFVSKSTVVSATTRQDGLFDVVLDKTIFYPKGGGQPSDTGRIICTNAELHVQSVSLDGAGMAQHVCSLYSGRMPGLGDEVEMHVDTERRLQNARSHTGGHIIDLAVQLLPFRREALKASHAPSESWIQFTGDQLPAGCGIEDIKAQLFAKVHTLIEENIAVRQSIPSSEEIAARGFAAPPGKTVRLVSFEGYESFARGCGGTHVRSTAEVGDIVIKGARARKGILSVMYEVK